MVGLNMEPMQFECEGLTELLGSNVIAMTLERKEDGREKLRVTVGLGEGVTANLAESTLASNLNGRRIVKLSTVSEPKSGYKLTMPLIDGRFKLQSYKVMGSRSSWRITMTRRT